MANAEHLEQFKQGFTQWNEWRDKRRTLRPDLSGANLSNTVLMGANFFNVNLMGADLSNAALGVADLSYANLSYADLSLANLGRANLGGADLSYADLSYATLVGANLSDANIMYAYLRQAKLMFATLSGAIVGWTSFNDVDLSSVEGLETVKHKGPSSIGIDTIFRSHGTLPDVFLRLAGVPESFRTYMPSLVGQPFDYFSCFISHSSLDKSFCDRLYADLQSKGVRTWYFPEDARWGEPIWGEIDRSIKVYDKLIVVCSENSLQSGPVQREIERALTREDKEGKNILFPLRLDDYLFASWKHRRKIDVTEKVVGDFRGWKRNHAKYDAAFKRLLAALQAQQ